MKRQKHVKTEYEIARNKYRKASGRHVVTFESDLSEEDLRHVFAYADNLRVLGNDGVGYIRPRIELMMRTKAYRALQKDYGWHVEHMKGLQEDSDRYQELEKEREAISGKMDAMQQEYGITFNALLDYMNERANEYYIDSIFAKTRAEDIWKAVESIIYRDGKTLHFKKRGDLPVIRAKQTERGITLKVKNGRLELGFIDLNPFHLDIPSDDRFLQDEYKAILDYMNDPFVEEYNVNLYNKHEKLTETFRPCYVSLKPVQIRHKLHVYVQITVAAKPMPKYDRQGNPRHKQGKGRVGVDLGTQSIAVVSDGEIMLENLAERDYQSTRRSEKKIARLQREMDRSIRATNPDRFDKDGRYIKGKRGKLKKSKHYKRKQYLLREQQRRDADTRKYAVQTDVNRLRALGDELIIEPGTAKSLQKHAKGPAEKSDKTIEVTNRKGETKVIYKNKRKKRWGKSIHFRCPGMYKAMLKKLFGNGYHEVARMFRASQFDHISGEYIKKKLSERWHYLPDGRKVQRDIYSAFLLYCADMNYENIDQQYALKEFEKFYTKHNQLVDSIKANNRTVCNSGI